MLTPSEKIQQMIINIFIDDYMEDLVSIEAGLKEQGIILTIPVSNNIKEVFDYIHEEYGFGDVIEVVRESGERTGVKCGRFSRHYECVEVAAEMLDGSWVGWTFWYGGGKHGNPEEIPWIEDAYDLNVSEEEKVVIVRTFTKSEV
jgi:hypothetical protein